MKWSDMLEIVESEGYTVSFSPESVEIDRIVAESIPCPKCGGERRFEGLQHSKRVRFYRAFAICQLCNHAEEF